MTKKYSLLETDVAEDQKTIVISEEVTTTKEERVTIAQLKGQYQSKLKQIEMLQKEADKIIDRMQDINDNPELAITVSDIPQKLQVSK